MAHFASSHLGTSICFPEMILWSKANGEAKRVSHWHTITNEKSACHIQCQIKPKIR